MHIVSTFVIAPIEKDPRNPCAASRTFSANTSLKHN